MTNGFGQTVAEAQANTLGGLIDTRREYNAKGQLVKSYRDTGSDTPPTAATLYEYDSFGNVTKETLALAETPTIANSVIVETAHGVESTAEGVFSIVTQTRYNAAGSPLTNTQKQLISELDETLAEMTLLINERDLTSTNKTMYAEGVKKVRTETIPTSSVTAQTVEVDGFVLSQSDHAGITTAATRRFTDTGMTLTQTNGRGNVATTRTDQAGRTVSVTGAAGNTTATSYDAHHDQPAVITDALGNTACYRYDIRGRKVAKWGTGIQPATFRYDEADRLIALTTFQASEGDTTAWTYDAATGLELSKTYADNTSVVKTYDGYNCPTTIWARPHHL